ncbi:MAG: 4-alpha-glucanotransferase [Acidithiobacillales bacterium SG8_45]|jgi:4-alpha-glucanotransferase|nr:MAG: 4-alpha-glucanotransferase [Acidithiobacillales bacterium SG8_45]
MTTGATLFTQRRAGVVLHPTSLPGPLANGDLGDAAWRFVDFLHASGFSVWQILPHGPTHEDRSPYQSLSVHAGNPLWISLDRLVEAGWLSKLELPSANRESDDFRYQQLRLAHRGFEYGAADEERRAYSAFRQEHAGWLDDYALFIALREEQEHRSWLDWPEPLKNRDDAALKQARTRLTSSIEQVCFEQFIFYRQWHALKQYANEKGVTLFGDLPIYVSLDSADVWSQREQFDLDDSGSPRTVAGVPPDYFSETGQRWGNPHYNWKHMRADHFSWWQTRLESTFALYDLVRIDHFRGFEAYWSIPAESETAIDGEWVKAPGEALFASLAKTFGSLPVVAEDLGVITDEVTALRKQFGFPGMRVLQFAFDGTGSNPYLPHQHEVDDAIYTGTHDNDTTLAWYNELDSTGRDHVREYLGYPEEAMPWPLIRTALASVGCLAIVPMQDLLGLGAGNRMNTPGTIKGNWQWRFDWAQLPEGLAGRLHHLLMLYGRLL